MAQLDTQPTKIITKNQSGQTLVEFVLLLAVIATLSFTFMSQMNRITGERWKTIAQIILDDETQQLELR